MTNLKLGDELAKQIHVNFMKRLGFKKKGKSFERQCQSHYEKFNIQGSSWNSQNEPWMCYVNVYVKINDIPVREGFVFHAHGRLEGIVEKAPHRYDLTTENLNLVASEIGMYIIEAIEAIPTALEDVRTRAMEGLYSPFPVPETWLNETKA